MPVSIAPAVQPLNTDALSSRSKRSRRSTAALPQTFKAIKISSGSFTFREFPKRQDSAVIRVPRKDGSCGSTRRNDRESPNPRGAVNLKIAPVQGEDPPLPFAFGNAHQGRVRQVHRQITVLAHQLSHARQIIDT